MHNAIPITLLVPLLLVGARATREVRRHAFQDRIAAQAEGDVARAAAPDAELRERLARVDRLIVELPRHPAAEQRESMRAVARSLREHAASSAAAEERLLYSVLDRNSRTGTERMQTTPYERAIVDRWIEELEGIADARTPDATAFARRAQRTLGLFEARLGAEEDASASAQLRASSGD